MKRVILVIVLAIAVFAGCIGNEAAPSEEETKSMVSEAIKNVTTYKFRIDMDQAVQFNNLSGEGSVDGETISLEWVGVVDLIRHRSWETTDLARMPLKSDQKFNQSMESYYVANITYQRVGTNWIKLRQSDPEYIMEKANQVSHLEEIIDRSQIEFETSEKVNGIDAYRFKVIPDDDTAYGVMAGQISSIDPRLLLMINMTGLFEVGSDMDWTVWIAKDTHVPVKSQIKSSYVATSDVLNLPKGAAEDLSIRFETLEARQFSDYGTSLNITPPDVALKAPFLLPPALPTGTNATFSA